MRYLQQFTAVLALSLFTIQPTSLWAMTCTGMLDHMFGNYPVTYELDDISESTSGYVKFWGPAAGAWTEGTYQWDEDEALRVKILTMRFGQETNICKSYWDYQFKCKSDMSPLEWEISCERR